MLFKLHPSFSYVKIISEVKPCGLKNVTRILLVLYKLLQSWTLLFDNQSGCYFNRSHSVGFDSSMTQ
ncbi:CLUMA_CG003318, isoform A [Clunio marinus]|uniref:CLUMA_CG003318, isoform A n=1 Tax=Clunio marinus TaxID=568069 RepID=A0A1J1HQ12_9DIPT|nr:CLUMA_CG003318, isoform A [Clunio marinus]